MPLTSGSLFSGYGGLIQAVEEVFGAETVFVSDIDSGPCKILAHRYPGTPNLGDISSIDWTPWVGKIDILEGGSPCQDLSTAGRRAGMTDGTRSNLWVMMREAIAQLRPRFVVWENVRGAFSARASSAMESDPRLLGDHPAGEPALRALGRVLGDLASLGYDAQWCGLRAADVGAPHGRFRVFLLAIDATRHEGRQLDGDSRLADADPHPLGLERSGQAWIGRNGSAHHGIAPALLGTPRASEWKGSGPLGSRSHQHRLERDYLDAQTIQLASDPGQWGMFEPAIRRWEHVLGREAPSATTLGRKGETQLSPHFTEWLMGLPAGWVCDVPGITRNEALKACGNGVVPQQAAAALRHMLANA